MKFNLLDEPWLPCYDLSGRAVELSIRDALARAHELRELRDGSPLATCSLQRLLLAILHRGLAGPKTMKAWIALWERRSFDPAPMEKYFKKWESRFDLFDEEYPFYQIGKFETDDLTPIAKLSEDLAKKNNATLFDHSVDGSSRGMTFAEAARRLVSCQAFSLGGGRSAKSKKWEHPNFEHGPMVGGVCAMLKGQNLFENLVLNLLVLDASKDLPVPGSGDDAPAWELEKSDKPGRRICRGWLDLLTWQSRYLRLVPEKGGVGSMYYSSGLSLDSEKRPRDPFWFHKLDSKGDVKPVRLSLDRMVWRDLEGLFAFAVQAKKVSVQRPAAFDQIYKVSDGHEVAGLGEKVFVFQIFGMANDKAKPLHWMQLSFAAPLAVLKKEGDFFLRFSSAIKIAEDAGKAVRTALWIYAKSFLSASKEGANPASEELNRLQDHFGSKHQYWQVLDVEFRRFLGALPNDAGRALQTWAEEVRQAAFQALEDSLTGVENRGARALKAKVEASAQLGFALNRIVPKQREVVRA